MRETRSSHQKKVFCHYFAQQMWDIMDQLGYTTFPTESDYSPSEQGLRKAFHDVHDILVENGS